MQKNLLTFLIDDDKDDQEIFLMALKHVKPFAECVFANDGIHALNKFNTDGSFMPQIIFIDINMPRMNGIQCLQEIKKLKIVQHIPAYMYSTSNEPAIIDECLKLGAAGYIKKEIDIEDLEKQLTQVLSQL